MQAVTTIVLVQSARKANCSVERVLRSLRLSKADLEVQGGILHCQPLTHRRPWECSTAGEVGPAPPGHMLRILWRRDPEDEGSRTTRGWW